MKIFWYLHLQNVSCFSNKIFYQQFHSLSQQVNHRTLSIWILWILQWQVDYCRIHLSMYSEYWIVIWSKHRRAHALLSPVMFSENQHGEQLCRRVCCARVCTRDVSSILTDFNGFRVHISRENNQPSARLDLECNDAWITLKYYIEQQVCFAVLHTRTLVNICVYFLIIWSWMNIVAFIYEWRELRIYYSSFEKAPTLENRYAFF